MGAAPAEHTLEQLTRRADVWDQPLLSLGPTTYSGGHFGVWQDRTRKRSPCIFLALTPPFPGGRRGISVLSAVQARENCHNMLYEKTRKAYQQDIPGVTTFLRITQPEESTTPKGEW